MADTVADLLVDRVDWEVDTVFSLPGDGINGILNPAPAAGPYQVDPGAV
jgi:hypothetical protein